MENPSSTQGNEQAFDPEVLTNAFDQFNFSQNSIWGNYDQDNNFQDQDLSLQQTNLTQNGYGISKGDDEDSSTFQYKYSNHESYSNKSHSTQSFSQKPLISNSGLAGSQEYLEMGKNELQNSLQPLDAQELKKSRSSNMAACGISVPHQLQRNGTLQNTPSPTGQHRISPKMISDQKGGKRQSMLNKSGRVLTCVVVPMDPDVKPYQINIKVKGNETSLKQVFTEDYFYWKKVFKGYSPTEPPGYSVYRKQLKGDQYPNQILQVLLLKCEGHKFPRNPNAHPFELHCETLFYGPLVVAINMKEQPYSLCDFSLEDVENLHELNKEFELEKPQPLDLKNYKKCVPEYHLPDPLLNIDVAEENAKMRFVFDYFNKNCSKREQLNMRPAPVNLEDMMTKLDKESFYIYRFKTEMCPHINMKHNYKDCLYFHNMKDYRRKPDFIRYYPEN